MKRVVSILALAVCAACPPLDKKAQPNALPTAIAEASPQGAVAAGVEVTLDGSKSSDPEGRALTFRWAQLAGTPVALGAQDAPVTTFTADGRAQTLLFSLTVNDGRQDSAPAYVRVVVDFNTRPVAIPPDARDVATGSQVLLSGHGEDADGDAITGHAWTVTASPATSARPMPWTLSAADTASPIFTPRLKGLYSLSYVVTDERGAKSLAATVVVRALNVAPVATAPATASGPNGTAISVTAQATDADPDDTATFSWRLEAAPPGAPLPLLTGAATSTVTLTPKARGLYTLAVVASDGEAESAPWRVIVSADNNPPTATAPAQSTLNTQPLTLAASAADPDGDSVSLEWSVSANPHPYSLTSLPDGTTRFVPQGKGAYQLAVVPFDGQARGAPVAVTVSSLNQPPVAVASSSVATASAGEAFTLSAAGSTDPDGPVSLGYRWRVKQGQASFDGGASAAQVQAVAGPLKQPLLFELVTFDDEDAGSAPATVQVVVDNTAPVAVAAAPATAGAATVVQLDATQSSDLETSSTSLQYAWSSPSLPGLVFSPSPLAARPTIVAPLSFPDGGSAVGKAVQLRLDVSDGRASSSATTAFTVLPTDATHLFVDVSATCGASPPCDGTRARPFKTLQAGVDASAALAVPKPVLVANGVYGPATIPAPVSVTGGCDPSQWLCATAASGTVVQAGPADLVALKLTGTSVKVGTVAGLTVYGSTGLDAGAPATLAAVECAGCRVNASDLVVDAQGSTARDDSTLAVWVHDTTGPVLFERLDVTAGRSKYNAAAYVRGSTGVRFVSSRLTTVPAIRQASATVVSQNVTVELNGSGSDVVFERSRLVAEGNATASLVQLVHQGESQSASFVGNLMWFKGNSLGVGLCCTAPPPNIAVLFDLFSTGGLSFVNNTILGTTAAYNAQTASSYVAFMFRRDGYCGGGSGCPATGLSFATNNYIQGFRRVLFQDASAELRMKNNTVFGVEQYSCEACCGGCGGNTVADLDTGFAGAAAGGSGNQTADCQLASFATGDGHLPASGSPCQDTGLADPLVPGLDLDGTPRPSGSAVDRGADEVP